MSQKASVLSLYRKVFRIARVWKAHSERGYIRDEVRRLVRQNADIKDPGLIAEKITEFDARIQTAVHYKIPFPRPTNVAPGATGKDPETVLPVYLHSYRTGNAMLQTGKPKRAPVYED